MRKLLYLSLALALSMPGMIFADDNDGYPTDSTNIHPPTLSEAPGAKTGFVLTAGSYSLLCDQSNSQDCNQSVTSSQCPAGYNPEATVSSVWNDYVAAYALRSIVLYSSDETPSGAIRPLDNGQGGYALHFDQAYAKFVGAFAKDQPVNINFSIDCIPA